MEKFSIIIRPFKIKDQFEVVKLWEICKLVMPWNDPYKDISRKMNFLPELFLVGIIEGKVNASVMGGYEGHRGWINYLAVNPKFQNNGIGKQMLEEIESRLKLLNCPKVNLQIRQGNEKVFSFYKKLGYIDDKILSMGKRLEKDN